MLRKLMKHEFRATGRVLLPLFGILLLAALAAWRLAGESAATAWEERREGGTDIGL